MYIRATHAKTTAVSTSSDCWSENVCCRATAGLQCRYTTVREVEVDRRFERQRDRQKAAQAKQRER